MQTDSFKKSVTWLESYIPDEKHKHPGEVGLERMKKFAELLGNPQRNFPVILVAGTSGKGSTSTFLSSILSQKYKVGLHVKPHLVTVCERIQINGEMISEKEFVQLVTLVKFAVEKMEKTSYGKPSYFEILVGMSYLYFAQQNIDIAVVEVGMGGKLDGTNVVNPVVSVITSIGFDHVPFLGTTLPEILKEKAGIIKNGSPVISGISQPNLILQLNRICEKEKSRLFLLERDFRGFTKKIDIHGSVFNYRGIHTYNNLHLPVLGSHQIKNALVAVRTIEEVNQILARHSGNLDSIGGVQNLSLKKDPGQARMTYICISEENIRKGLLKVKIPGRMEIVSTDPLILLDGAHNEDKSHALTESIQVIFPQKKITTIVAIKKDKNASQILKSLIQISSEFILTQFPIYSDVGNETSIHLEDLKNILNNLKFKGKITKAKSTKDALRFAKADLRRNGMILITGSMYLVGKYKRDIQWKKQIYYKNSGLHLIFSVYTHLICFFSSSSFKPE